DINAGLTLASGDINDPISANQTTNQFYTRKAIAIDKAFVNYNPHQFKPLTLTGGKFAYPWYNTELTWDRDLNPEGVAQTLAFDLNSPVLKRIALVGFELPFAEVAGTSVNNKSIVQALSTAVSCRPPGSLPRGSSSAPIAGSTTITMLTR